MLERSLQELFEQMASADQPPNPISVPHVIQQGRLQRRWRRIGTLGAPVMAASAALAIALTGAIPSGGQHSGPRRDVDTPARAQAALRQFNPLVQQVSFGWLPGGRRGSQLVQDTYSAALSGGPGARWSIYAMPVGLCNATDRQLTCLTPGAAARSILLATRAPNIDGHPAYWGYGSIYRRETPPDCARSSRATGGVCLLIFQYARGAWAWLDNPPRRDAVKVARNVIVGTHMTPIRFPARLSGVPGSWFVSQVLASYSGSGSQPVAYQYAIAGNRRKKLALAGNENLAMLIINPATNQAGQCGWPYFFDTHVIDGFKVIITDSGGSFPIESACAADADGLSVTINLYGKHPPMPVASIFKRLTFLGRDPVHWTTKPIG